MKRKRSEIWWKNWTARDERVKKMQLIVRETDGLRNSLQFDDASVIARYRHLAGQFHGLIEEDLNARRGEIETLRHKLERN